MQTKCTIKAINIKNKAADNSGPSEVKAESLLPGSYPPLAGKAPIKNTQLKEAPTVQNEIVAGTKETPAAVNLVTAITPATAKVNPVKGNGSPP